MLRGVRLITVTFVMAFAVREDWDDGRIASVCPLPDEYTGPLPPDLLSPRTVLAAHPRSGSTWLRFLIERATHKPCGFEKADWANVLSHHGEDPDQPFAVNRHGIVSKTHSFCFGCWAKSADSPPPRRERLKLNFNSTWTTEQLTEVLPEELVNRMRKHGICLGVFHLKGIHPAEILDKQFAQTVNRLRGGKGREAEHMRKQVLVNTATLPCTFTVDRAVLLVRYPLDVVRSNYHYRTKVLNMKSAGTWSEEDYAFPRERGEAWVDSYKSWARFAEHKPVLRVLYEDLKANTTRELRRVLDFLGHADVSDEKVACAVAASTIDRLQKSDRILQNTFRPRDDGERGDNFFGSRRNTEAAENLQYSGELLRHFEDYGMFDIAHGELGYTPRDGASQGISRNGGVTSYQDSSRASEEL